MLVCQDPIMTPDEKKEFEERLKMFNKKLPTIHPDYPKPLPKSWMAKFKEIQEKRGVPKTIYEWLTQD